MLHLVSGRNTFHVVRRLVFVGIGLVAIALLYVLFSPPSISAVKPAGSLPVPVIFSKVSQELVTDYVNGIGTVSAVESATLRSRLDGELVRLNFVEGQDVKAGDVLAEIDSKALRAQLGIAQAQLARDEALLHNAESDAQRYASLVDKGLIAKQMLETQRALVTQYQATVRADQAQTDYARVQLGYSHIRAPFDGRTGVRLTGPGNLLRAADPIVVLNRIDQVALSFSIPESAFLSVQRAASSARSDIKVLALDNRNQVISEGKFLLVDNHINTESGTVQIKAVFDNAHHSLWPGQFVSARLLLGRSDSCLVLPASAVQRGPEGNFVYVVDNGKAIIRAIQVSRLQEDKAIIASGVSVGEVVVAEGQSKLRPGMRVTELAGAAHVEHTRLANVASQQGR